ncbi:PTS lactose/cellobiose transporter subunit IIA [Enterococcus hulanensis]|uniref:PTS lactose/cellobiose transporter subunit IIA n=1 Tax=Enterococcus hulanensis TaxID=2559929 RepID=UPI001A90C923|nr:PTS lactose/cellobiose transporter subunit IIA [Enterococcus hulanensis]MBO0457205.1 PTS lactose/cellobiose transporter subunit IIA [Enterococcus hulanensis]
MTNQEQLEAVMGLIIHSGNAKSEAVEAIEAAKNGDLENAMNKLDVAGDALLQAHHSQTEMLTKEAQGQRTEMNLLTVHSQDHLMTSIAFTDMAKEIVDLYKRIS